jgi:hypothetical protein
VIYQCEEILATRYLSIASNGIAMANAALYRTKVRFDQSVVRPYAGLRVDAPILVIDRGLSVRVGRRFLGKLTFPDEARTKVRILPIEANGIREHGKSLHELTPAGCGGGTVIPAACWIARQRATRAI